MRSRRSAGAATVTRRFGVPLHPAETQVSKRQGFRSNQVFQPLPVPTGPPPYHLDLATVIGPHAVADIGDAGQLVLNCVGDTGGVNQAVPQQIVAYWLEQETASFLYHLGDVVYFNGQIADYYPQFYEPYAGYQAPIFAIPGNHDGDPLDALVEPSLAGFVENFCALTPHLVPEAQEIQRDTMTQPNVYWTLVAPFLTVIGLYTNVPEGGRLDQDQIAWLQSELAAAPTETAVAVAMHHPPYSADAHHGGSSSMGEVLDAAMDASGRTPDLVLTGHVHDYQRFTRSRQGRQIPYVVAGAGGYWHLHYMAKDANGDPLPKPWQTPDADVTLENYVDDRHGFLRLTVDPKAIKGEYVTVPRPQESWRHGPVATADTFTIDLEQHTVTGEPSS